MSSALGIAAVTHVLKDLLNDGLINRNVAHVVNTNVLVSSLCPGQIDNSGGNSDSQLNLFLYRVSPNTGWNNLNYPSRNSNGELINTPYLALNLHCLLTAFGEDELHGEVLLGYGMQLLHENPVLSRERIRTSLTAPGAIPTSTLPNNLRALATSGLGDQIEQIRITLETINTEEISRLWTAFQTRYRPCTGYLATVLLIESDRPGKTGPPVREPRVFALPFKRPIIEKILSQAEAVPENPILENRIIGVGDRIFIRGKQLKSEEVEIQVNGKAVPLNMQDVSDTEISLIVPDSLKAGIQGVQVVQSVTLKMPNKLEEDGAGVIQIIEQAPEQRKGSSSNLQAFVLSPIITSHARLIVGANLQIDLTLTPPVHQKQKVLLLLNQINVPAGRTPHYFSYLLPAEVLSAINNPVNAIRFSIPRVPNGTYLVRVQVDGAESPLETNANQEFIGPQIQVP